VKYASRLLIVTVLFFVAAFAATNANGEKLYDFNFVNTDVEAVFRALAVTAGVDILPTPDLSGEISVRIRQKTWQEALDIICTLNGYTWIVEDKYIRVMKKSDWVQQQMEEAALANRAEEMAPFVRRNFSVRHAKAADLLEVFNAMKSDRGTISMVERTNSIIVYDTEKRLAQMEKTLEELDRETLQVMITAKLVVVDASLKREMGVNWNARLGTGTVTAGASGVPAGTISDSRNQVAIASTPGQLADPATSISMGLLDNNLGLSIENFLSEGKTEVLASPQISTMDHTEAEIFMGKEVSIRVIDEQGQPANQLIEAGIKLTVTPHITGDNRIMMELAPENNDYSIDEAGQPIISKQEAMTTVVVNDGETVVIAGLAQNKEDEVESGIPFLKDIPLFGNLFKHKRREVTKNDLMIFVTPRIMKSSAFRATEIQQSSQQSSKGSASGATMQKEPQPEVQPVQQEVNPPAQEAPVAPQPVEVQQETMTEDSGSWGDSQVQEETTNNGWGEEAQEETTTDDGWN